jgi:hypothetical protein
MFGGVCLRVPGAQVDQDRRDVDLDRADVVTRPAQRRRVRQRGVVLDSGQLRRQDRADRARIDGPVRVPARALVYRAHIQARAATNAVQRVPAAGVGEHGSPSVVEQNQVEFLRAVAWRDTGPHRGVRVHPLTGG